MFSAHDCARDIIYLVLSAICACPYSFVTGIFQVGDFLNFLSAVFFGVHMLRTEHISRSTEKENLLPLLGCEVQSIHRHVIKLPELIEF